MIRSVEELITSLGLPDLQARVFLAGFELGPTSVQEIAKKAGVSRAAGYTAARALQQDGLMTVRKHEKKTLFCVEGLDKLVAYFHKRLAEEEEELNQLESRMPDVHMLAAGDKPRLKFFEGDELIEKLLEDIDSASPERLQIVGDLDKMYASLGVETIAKFRKVLKKHQVRVQLLYTGEFQYSSEIEARKIHHNVDMLEVDILVYADRVAFVDNINKSIAIIISHQHSRTAGFLFRMGWQFFPEESK